MGFLFASEASVGGGGFTLHGVFRRCVDVDGFDGVRVRGVSASLVEGARFVRGWGVPFSCLILGGSPASAARYIGADRRFFLWMAVAASVGERHRRRGGEKERMESQMKEDARGCTRIKAVDPGAARVRGPCRMIGAC